MSNDVPITWGGRDLSTSDAIMHYRGRLRIEPIRGSADLPDLEGSPSIDQVLQSDEYEIDLRVMRRLAKEEAGQTAFDAAKVRSKGVESDILAGGSAYDAEFAAAVGCTIPELLARCHRHEFFCVEFGGNRHWPRWQLGVAGLSTVLSALAAKEVSGFSVALFFTTPSDVLSLDDIGDELHDVRENDSPLSLLRRAGAAAVSRVERHARRFGEHGAT